MARDERPSFDSDAFTFDPSPGFRVEDLWEALGR